MDATRARLSLEHGHFTDLSGWAAAVATVFATLLLTALVVREVRFATRAADSATAGAASAAVPAEAVSVPALVLGAGREIHVGDTRASAAPVLAPIAIAARTEEPGRLGVREVRVYQGFTLVLEPFEAAGEPKIAAIYLQ